MGNQENVAHIYAWQYGNAELENKICSRVWDHIYFWWYHEFEIDLSPKSVKHINKQGIKYTIVTCLNDLPLLQKKLRVIGLRQHGRADTWPEFFIIRSHQELLNNNFHYKDLILEDKHTWDIWKYPFLSMNGRERHHRDVFIDVLARENLIDKGLVTYHQTHRNDDPAQYFKWHDGSRLTTSDRFTEKLCSFDFNDDFIYSFLHIPTESYTEGMTITEKTATPMLCKLPFLTVGSRYFHSKLMEMGFEIYDEVFDYSFDNLKTDEERIEGIVKNIKYVVDNKHNLKGMYDTLKPKLKKNVEHIFDKYISKFEHVPSTVKNRIIEITTPGGIFEGDEGELITLARRFKDKEISTQGTKERRDYLWYNYWCAHDNGDGFNFAQIIKDLKTIHTTKVVIDGSAEWEPWFDPEYVEYVNAHPEIETIVISGCQKNSYYQKKLKESGINKIRSLHWSTFFFHYSTKTIMDSYEDYGTPNDVRDFWNIDDNIAKWPWICLQNRAHLHRCHLIDNIKKHNLQDSGYVTWIDGGKERPDFPYKYHDGKQMTLENDTFSLDMDSYKLPEEYWHTLCDFVSEACWETVFVTEKTIYPLLSKKLFLVCGGYGFHEYLDKLGFVRYDEIFDYSFDKEPDLEKRVAMYAEEMVKYSENSFSTIKTHVQEYNELYHKIEYNHNHVFEILKQDLHMPKAVKYQWSRIDTEIQDQALPEWQHLYLNLKKQVQRARKEL